MAATGLAALLSVLLVLPSSILAATIHSERESVVRRERVPESSVQLNPNGELFQKVSSEHRQAPVADTHEDNKDFILGEEGTVKTCKQKDSKVVETPVTSKEQCIYAAWKVGAHIELETDGTPTPQFRRNFELTNDRDERWQHVHPEACFHTKCFPGDDHTKPEQDCFFFNPSEGKSDPAFTFEFGTPLAQINFTGTPVCMRELYKDGTKNLQAGCPPEYQVVMDHNVCQELCERDDYHCGTGEEDTGPIWEIGAKNYSQHNEFQQGCFYVDRKEQGKDEDFSTVYFNPLNTLADGAAVTGTAFCVVANRLKFEKTAHGNDGDQAAKGTCADVVCESPKVKDAAKAAEACEGTPADCTTAESETKCCTDA